MQDTKRTKILIADDETVIADTLAMILTKAGYEARAVYSGSGALLVADTFQPDMFISDVVMPGMTGIEAAIQLSLRQPSCKILLFSGQAATADLLKKASEQNYHFEILSKPIHPADLLAKLRYSETVAQ